MQQRGDSLVVLIGLGIGLGHWGRSGRCFAERLLEIQIDDGEGVEGPFVGTQDRGHVWVARRRLSRRRGLVTQLICFGSTQHGKVKTPREIRATRRRTAADRRLLGAERNSTGPLPPATRPLGLGVGRGKGEGRKGGKAEGQKGRWANGQMGKWAEGAEGEGGWVVCRCRRSPSKIQNGPRRGVGRACLLPCLRSQGARYLIALGKVSFGVVLVDSPAWARPARALIPQS